MLTEFAAAENSKFSVLLDPGHGGSDRGASIKSSFKTINESDLTLKLSQKIISIIAEKHSDIIEISTTRDFKKYISLQKRAETNINQKNDLFLSLHYNSSFSNTISGTEIYFPTKPLKSSLPSDSILNQIKSDLTETGRIKKSLTFAKILPSFWKQPMAVSANTSKVKIRRSSFYVLEKTKSPALLIEVGYLTNEADQAVILNPEHQNQTAEAIVKAILQFKEMSDKQVN